jgi:hypothetical protein
MNLIIAAFSVTVRRKKHTGAAIFIRNGKSIRGRISFFQQLRTRSERWILAYALHLPTEGNSSKLILLSGFQNYDSWATDNRSRTRENRLQVIFVELCENFTFSKSKHYFAGLDFEALSRSLITVISVFAATVKHTINDDPAN